MSVLRVKSFRHKSWLLVFRHSTRKTVSFFTKETAMFNNEEDKFSIIGMINSTFKYDSKYEFLLEYPETNEYCIWRQSLSPIEHAEDNNPAEGFEPIRLIPNGFTFRGLQKSAYSTTLIDGDSRSSYWMYAIGAGDSVYRPSFPCYNRSKPSCKEVNLFIRIRSSLTCKCKSMRSSSFFAFACVFLMLGSNIR